MTDPLRAAILLVLALHAAASAQSRADTSIAADRAISRAAKFLIDQQSADGAWRSHVYGVLKDGTALTPQIVLCLQSMPHDPDTDGAIKRARKYLSSLTDDAGPVRQSLMFPAYNAAIISRLQPHHRSAWIESVRFRQLAGDLGWQPGDPEFGGWGYAASLPRKPGPGLHDPTATANLSATLASLEALRDASVTPDDPAISNALVFVQRCQNFANAPDPVFDDGGFFFMPKDAAWNKAGLAGTDRLCRVRFNSYGSATADGLRALLDAGLPPGHPRVVASRRWLETHFDPESNPGVFPPDRQVLRNATYYYYLCSLAQAFSRIPIAIEWRSPICDALIHRQAVNGSWHSSFTDGKEDDPLVATPQAITALIVCRH
ncbi:MAG TPA: hypothetical protein VK797_18465 [Tepidisphaeraceae bacterium]|nr:hypothetical protein [Tepidisphaeraceae bacterium]